MLWEKDEAIQLSVQVSATHGTKRARARAKARAKALLSLGPSPLLSVTTIGTMAVAQEATAVMRCYEYGEGKSGGRSKGWQVKGGSKKRKPPLTWYCDTCGTAYQENHTECYRCIKDKSSSAR